MNVPIGFQPIINSFSEILILGSMPGEESLRKNEYYGNPRNQFWRILYSLFREEKEESYERRLAFALDHRVALWDVIETCHRTGSLDASIKGESANNFHDLFLSYPNLRVVAFNGGKAYEVYRRQVGFTIREGLVYHTLPSTSPANTMSYEDKLEKWQALQKYLR